MPIPKMKQSRKKERVNAPKSVQKIRNTSIISHLIQGGTTRNAEKEIGLKGHGSTVYNKSFKELLEEILPDQALLTRHKALMDDHRHIREITLNTTDSDAIKKATQGIPNVSITINKEKGITTLIINEPDRQARKEALEMAYKIKGYFAPQRLEIKRDYEELDDDEIMGLLQGMSDDDTNPLK